MVTIRVCAELYAPGERSSSFSLKGSGSLPGKGSGVWAAHPEVTLQGNEDDRLL